MRITDTEPKPPPGRDRSLEDLKEENERLRDLVVDLSRIIARSMLSDKKR